jgi:hypothetical protein
MRGLLVLSLAVALATTASGCYVEGRGAVVAQDGFVLLGERRVAGRGQAVHEAIGGLKRDGQFSQIRLVVRHAPVEMHDVVVTFGNGEQFRPGERLMFSRGTESRDIPLPGGMRFIRRVDFVFANLPMEGHAIVQLWAR